MSVSEIILALSFSIGSIVLLTKNITQIKSFCCSCEQETSGDREEELKALEASINETIKNLEQMKTITPRLRGEDPRQTDRSTTLS